MKQTLHLTIRFALVLLFAALCVSGIHAQDAALPRTLVPDNKMDVAWWKARHEANCARIAQGNEICS